MLVELLLEKGADPNSSLISSTIWREYLRGLLCFLTDPKVLLSPQSWATFRLMITHGASIRDHLIPWGSIALRASSLNADALSDLIQGIHFLLNHGLDPNTMAPGVDYHSTWRALLWSTIVLEEPQDVNFDAIMDLIKKFLLHGASISALSSSKVPWLPVFLDKMASWPRRLIIFRNTQLIEVLLQNCLDPNELCGSSTVWGHFLQALSRNIVGMRFNMEDYRNICNLLLLFLRYGADPEHEELAKLTTFEHHEWLSLARQVRQAIQREVSERLSSRSVPSLSRSHASSDSTSDVRYDARGRSKEWNNIQATGDGHRVQDTMSME